MKKLLSVFLTLAVFCATIFSFAIFSYAQDVPQGTQLKTSNTYYYYNASDKSLNIYGTGDIPNYSNGSTPWAEWPSDRIEKVVVGEGITAIGNYTFYQVKATSFSIPRTIKRIGTYALACTYGMTKWDLPFGIESISNYAFFGCSSMIEINLPKSLKTIGSRAFDGCVKLERVTIPSSVSSIGSYAFNGCSQLSNIEFASLTQTVTIGSNAFLGCSSIGDVALPMYSSLSTRSIGYNSTSAKNENIRLKVFRDSLSHIYAEGNGLDFLIIDTIPLACGVEYKNTYTEDNLALEYHYTFTPSENGEYVFYTNGDCDTVGKLYDNSSLIGENDDIDNSNRGFSITQNLVAGNTYDLFISSNRLVGDYSLFVYPTNITGLNVYSGSVEMNASDRNYNDLYIVTYDMMKDFIVDVTFGDVTESMYFTRYVAGQYFRTIDSKDYTCGVNKAPVYLGNAVGYFDLIITHSFKESFVSPTVDEDGYTLHSCILCRDSYKDNYVATTSFVVTGKCVMDEDGFGSHENNMPYSQAYITVDNRRYNINSDGTWTIRTFDNCQIVFNNPYGKNSTKNIDISNGSYNFGTVVLEGYDINGDGYVNAKDYAIYYREKRSNFGDDYWLFGDNYLIRY